MIPGKYIAASIVVLLLVATAIVGIKTFGSNTFGASVFAVFQGGTGTSSPSGILYGSGSATALKTVVIGSNLTFSGGTLSAATQGGTATTSFTATYPIQVSTSPLITYSIAFGTTTANIWSALQTFTSGFISNSSSTVTGQFNTTNASSTFLSILTSLWIPNSTSQAPTQAGQLALDTTNDQVVIGDGSVTSVFDKRRSVTLSYGTSTAWAASTTLPAFVIPFGYTWNTITCLTQPVGSTLNAQYQYANPTTYATVNATMVPASSTPGIVTFSTNNTPTAQATSTISFGTPASSPVSIACTLTGTVTGT